MYQNILRALQWRREGVFVCVRVRVCVCVCACVRTHYLAVLPASVITEPRGRRRPLL